MKQFYDRHFIRLQYFLIGGWNTVFYCLVFVALYYGPSYFGVPLHYMVVLLGTQIMSLTHSFVLNKTFVFKTKGNFLREFGRFGIFYWLSFGANLVLLPFLVEFLKWPPVLSQGLLICVAIVSSYFWHSLVTFGIAPDYTDPLQQPGANKKQMNL